MLFVCRVLANTWAFSISNLEVVDADASTSGSSNLVNEGNTSVDPASVANAINDTLQSVKPKSIVAVAVTNAVVRLNKARTRGGMRRPQSDLCLPK